MRRVDEAVRLADSVAAEIAELRESDGNDHWELGEALADTSEELAEYVTWMAARIATARRAIGQHIAADECGTDSLRAALAALDEEE